MVTTVGMEADFLNVLGDLASLGYDAIAAYDSAIPRLENAEFRQALQGFRADHQRHIEELGAVIAQQGGALPPGAGAKSMLTTGKVVLGGLLGDKAILMAMKSNEGDTNTAYERAVDHDERRAFAEEMLTRALADERRHRDWIERTLATL